MDIYIERKSSIEKQQGQAFSMVRGKCMKILLDRMKYDPDWDNASTSYEPLQLLALIQKTVVAQTKYLYKFAMVKEQERPIYTFIQKNLSNKK